MPKKMGTNSKAEEARSRKAEAQTEKKVKDERQKEENFWKDAEGPPSKASKKKEEEAERKAEAAAKRAEAKKLAEQEEKELAQYGKRVDKKATRVAVPVPKVRIRALCLPSLPRFRLRIILTRIVCGKFVLTVLCIHSQELMKSVGEVEA